MNANLDLLRRLMQEDDEAVIEMVMITFAIGNNTATAEEREKYNSMNPDLLAGAMRIVRDFSDKDGRFNIDHVAWQLGIDTTAEGPTIPADHACDNQAMIYDGHIAAPGYGIATHCGTCSKAWIKVGNTYYPADEFVPELTPEDVH